jgi:hypothetical protein
MKLHTLAAIALLAAAAVAAQPAAAPSPSGAPGTRERTPAPPTTATTPTTPTTAAPLRAQIQSSLTALGDHMNFPRAQRELQTIFDQVIVYAPLDDAALFTDAAFALRLVTQLGKAEEPIRRPLYEFLRENDQFARMLVFLVAAVDNDKEVYAILERLLQSHRRALPSFAPLAAAICIVHDAPRPLKISSSASPRPIDPVALFDYYVSNERQMRYSPRTTAPELLIYMVDTNADIEELRWALTRHAGDRMVQNRYRDIPYDTGFYKSNRPKKIEGLPYTLENLRRVGGVCEEQGYFAAHVARAIGVPAVMITGSSGRMSHCWVGVLQDRSAGPVWNMQEGRYSDYKDLRGTVVHPQTRRNIPDDQVSLSTRIAATPLAQRHAAIAYSDAARRVWLRSPLANRDNSPARAPSPPVPGADARAYSNAAGLALLQRAATAAPAMPEVWLTLESGAQAMRISASDRIRWFEALDAAVGEDHPDFTHRILSALINSVEEPVERAAAWDWVVKRNRRRPDLAAQALVARGRAWEQAGDQHNAYTSYMEAVNKHINDTQSAVAGLLAAEELLIAGRKESHILDLYRQAFQRTRHPGTTSAVAFRQSSFYLVGERYATLLEAAGKMADARRVRAQIAPGDKE